MSTPPILSLDDLHFAYEAHSQVLRGVSLDILPGTITAILGPNGAGKTTLLRVILGLLKPQRGAIRLEGRPQKSFSRREMSRLIGLVPQSEYIPFDFSVLEFVLLGRAPYLGPLDMPREQDRDIALDALRAIGLEHLRERATPSLSGGERQLAMIARALAQQPRVLLLDEPTAHLDLSNRDRVLNVLRAQARLGVTVVFTTHDPNLAAAIADYVILMRQGALLAAGALESTLTAENLSATYGIPVRVLRMDGQLFVTA
ncbi:MAG: ABC transporter ATP-binding protein [Anaerolineae bacterium]|nr:ABC transporter ATP-binding protein [Anaerolineae bacterium]